MKMLIAISCIAALCLVTNTAVPIEITEINLSGKSMTKTAATNIQESKSFKKFINAIFQIKPTSLKYGPKIDNRTPKYDTIRLVNGSKIIRNLGLLKQFYFTMNDNSGSVWNNCYSFLGIGKKVFNKDTLMCWQQFQFLPDYQIIYRQSSFRMLKSGPHENCIGGACRINFYPVIGISRRDTNLHYFINNDDLTGMKYADLDHDGFLDFLSIQSGITIQNINELAVQNKKLKDLTNAEMGTWYKLTLFTFKEGKWELKRDKKGQAYYIIIKLDKGLDPESKFKAMASNWLSTL